MSSGAGEEKADERRGPKSGQTMAEILPDKWSPENAVAPAALPKSKVSLAEVAADEDWMAKMPPAMQKQMKVFVDSFLGAGMLYDKQRFLATAQQSPGQAGFHETVLKRMIRAPGEEFAPAEPKALAKIATLSPTEATHLLPHAARACCGPVLEALIRQGADLNSFNFQRGALTVGGSPFAIVAKKARAPVLELMLRVGGADPNATDAMGWTALHILCLCAGREAAGDLAADFEKALKGCSRAEAEAIAARQHGSVVESVRVMLAAGADPTLQTARQGNTKLRIYSERFFAHEFLADEAGEPLTETNCETIRSMLLDAIAARGGLPSARAQEAAAMQQRAAHREAVTAAAENGGDPLLRAGCTSLMLNASQQMTTAAWKKGEAGVQEDLKQQAKQAGRNRICDWCNKRSETKLQACGKCKFVFYCDAACQRRAWPTHKQDCGKALERLCLALERNASRIDTQHAAIQMQANEADDARRAAQN